jgi:hypothetical protein
LKYFGILVGNKSQWEHFQYTLTDLAVSVSHEGTVTTIENAEGTDHSTFIVFAFCYYFSVSFDPTISSEPDRSLPREV